MIKDCAKGASAWTFFTLMEGSIGTKFLLRVWL